MAENNDSNKNGTENAVTQEQTPRVPGYERAMRAKMKRAGVDPDGPDAVAFRNRFTWTGTAENVAIAQVALLENRDPSEISSAYAGLERSAMYKRLVDQQYREQNTSDQTVGPDSWVWLHAQLFVAGRIAERADRRRWRSLRKKAHERQNVIAGVKDDLEDLLEPLP